MRSHAEYLEIIKAARFDGPSSARAGETLPPLSLGEPTMSLYDHAALKTDAARSPASADRELDRIAERIRSAIGIVSQTSEALYDNANRVFGAPPMPACSGGAAAAPVTGSLSEIDELLATLNRVAMTNADQASRFGAL